jgi:precorrin-6A/cobalt-precorrin-6A reductase
VRVLVLGGTTEASGLARVLDGWPGVEVTTSFAGRTTAPRAAAGRTRVGGFGGAAGLARHLRDERVDVLVDATHPFAARMRWHAASAADEVGVPRLRVERPAWRAEPGDRWTPVADLDAAAAAIRDAGYRRALLTTGRMELGPFAACPDTWFLIRSVEEPDTADLARLAAAEVLLGRGPFTVEGERALLAERRIDAVVTKNSGGSATGAKLVAARDLGIPVVIVDRPPSPPGAQAATVADAVTWLSTHLPPHPSSTGTPDALATPHDV